MKKEKIMKAAKVVWILLMIIVIIGTAGCIFMRQPVKEASETIGMIKAEQTIENNSAAVDPMDELVENLVDEIVNSPAPEKTDVEVLEPEDEIKKLSDAEIVAQVLAGEWGNGAQRRDRLAAAGYDYEQIQKQVDAAMKASQPAQSQTGNASKSTQSKPAPEKKSTTVSSTAANDYAEASKGRIMVPSTGTSATIKSATFTPYNVQNVIDSGYAAYYSDYASNGSRKVYGGHNYSAFKGLSGVAVGASVWVDGKEYHVTKKVTGGVDDWSPIFDNTGIILQTCSGKGYNVYVVCN